MTEANESIPTTSTDLEAFIEKFPEEQILRFFRFSHLPQRLLEMSRNFANLALIVAGTLPRCPERTVALRKLLEGKDAAVRAAL